MAVNKKLLDIFLDIMKIAINIAITEENENPLDRAVHPRFVQDKVNFQQDGSSLQLGVPVRQWLDNG